jgi:hypothetical protein
MISISIISSFLSTKYKLIPEISTTQVDDSGHWIPQDPAGKMRESQRILQESTGNRWNMEEVFWL